MRNFIIDRRFLVPRLHEAAVETLEQKLAGQGYTVLKNSVHSGTEFDVVATKGPETIVYEIKVSGHVDAQKKVSQLRRRAEEFFPGSQFQLIFIPYPVHREIEIHDLESKIEFFLMNNFPSELDALSTHTRISEVADVDISSISISGLSVEISGSGAVSVDLQYGSDGDTERGDGVESTLNVPFTFEARLSIAGDIMEIDPCDFDLSNFYADEQEE